MTATAAVATLRILTAHGEHADMFSRFFTQAGHQAIAVHTFEALEERAAQEPFDVLVLHLRLWGGPVLEFTRCLRQVGYAGVIIIISGMNGLEEQTAAVSAGADEYVPLPVSQRELLDRVLARHAQRTIAWTIEGQSALATGVLRSKSLTALLRNAIPLACRQCFQVIEAQLIIGARDLGVGHLALRAGFRNAKHLADWLERHWLPGPSRLIDWIIVLAVLSERERQGLESGSEITLAGLAGLAGSNAYRLSLRVRRVCQMRWTDALQYPLAYWIQRFAREVKRGIRCPAQCGQANRGSVEIPVDPLPGRS